jgi:hypothetical protein
MSCNTNVSQDKGSIELKGNKINADSLISIFKLFWPKIDSIENELINKLNVKVIISSYEGEPDETCNYYLDTINYTLRSEFVSGGVYVSELRLLSAENTIKVMKSSFSGTNSFTNQDDFLIYDYNYNKKSFSIDTVAGKLFKVQLIDFFKENTPDSIITEFEGHSSYFFQTIYNESGVAEIQLFDESLEKNIKSNKWLKGNKITFYYKDNKFFKTETYFSID